MTSNTDIWIDLSMITPNIKNKKNLLSTLAKKLIIFFLLTYIFLISVHKSVVHGTYLAVELFFDKNNS